MGNDKAVIEAGRSIVGDESGDPPAGPAQLLDTIEDAVDFLRIVGNHRLLRDPQARTRTQRRGSDHRKRARRAIATGYAVQGREFRASADRKSLAAGGREDVAQFVLGYQDGAGL